MEDVGVFVDLSKLIEKHGCIYIYISADKGDSWICRYSEVSSIDTEGLLRTFNNSIIGRIYLDKLSVIDTYKDCVTLEFEI